MHIDCVAVYGTLRKGWYNHRLLETAEQLGTCRVDGWEMKSLGAFPAIHRGEGTVTIEVYRLNSADQLQSLDYLEGYRGEGVRNFYERTTLDTPYGKAFVYYQPKKALEASPAIPSGDWEDSRSRVNDR